jgi:beta-glucosidase
VAVVYVNNFLAEGADALPVELQRKLDPLISASARVNPRTVVVMNIGGPIDTPWRSRVASLVEGCYGGRGCDRARPGREWSD